MLMHCTIDELIAIRDGEGSQAASRHLDECEPCRNELERLHQRVAALKALPAARPPRDRWPVVRDRIVAERGRRRRRLAGWVAVGAAASVVLALGAGSLATPAVQPDPLAQLATEAEALQHTLETLRPRMRVINGRTAGTMIELEDRISLIEAQYAEAAQRRLSQEQLVQLMQERIALMNALVRVHGAPPRYVGF